MFRQIYARVRMVGRLFPLVARLSVLTCFIQFAVPSEHELVGQMVGPIFSKPFNLMKSIH